MRRILLFCAAASCALCACHSSPDASAPQAQKDAVQITKLPANIMSHKFDPAAPSPNMPPLHPGEAAVCDADFIARSSVRGQPRRTDSTHAILTITKVLMTLQLQTNIWVPIDAPQTITDHEEGHREIAEYYYQTADKLAERIAASYIGKRVEVTGDDLDVASSQKLLEIATEITERIHERDQLQLHATSLRQHYRPLPQWGHRERRRRPRHQKRRRRGRSDHQLNCINRISSNIINLSSR